MESLYDQEVRKYGFGRGLLQLVRLSDNQIVTWHPDRLAVSYHRRNTEVRDDGKSSMLHRLDGPAMLRSNGACFWFKMGKLFRKKGPCMEEASGTATWHIRLVLSAEVDYIRIRNCEVAAYRSMVEAGTLSTSIHAESDIVSDAIRALSMDFYYGRQIHPDISLPIWHSVPTVDVDKLPVVDGVFMFKGDWRFNSG